MRRELILIGSLLAVIVSMWTKGANAQDEEDADENILPTEISAVDDEIEPGWHPLLVLSGNFALGQTKNVPGTADGVIYNFGYLLNSGIGYLSDNREHEWLNTLKMQLGFSRTAVVDAVVKSLDTIDFKTSYLYHLPPVPWLGPFVSFRVNTAMLPGYDIRAGDTNVLKLGLTEDLQFSDAGNPIDGDGNVIDANHDRVHTVNAGNKIDLTEAFAPSTLKEGLGLFAAPISNTRMRLEARAGFGLWETFVRDGYVIDDNEATAELLELRALQDSVQLGPEIGLTFTGIVDDKITYSFGAVFMQPLYHNAETDLEGVELMNVELEAILGVALAEWMSIDYAFKAVRQPLLVEDWQIQNTLLVSINFNIVGAEIPEEECDCSKCPVVEATEEEEPAPVVDEPAPAVEEPAPTVEEPAPTVEEPAPSA